jgi:hypothetical protein
VAAGAEASVAGAGAVAVGAGAGAAASSFLLQAAIATAANRDANRSDFFIIVLMSSRFELERSPVVVGPLLSIAEPLRSKGQRSSSILMAQPAIIERVYSQTGHGRRKRRHGALRNCINQLPLLLQFARIVRHQPAMPQRIGQADDQ